jgi:hypothetical protein
MYFSSNVGRGSLLERHFTVSLNLVPRIRKGTVVLLLPLYALMLCSGTALQFFDT